MTVTDPKAVERDRRALEQALIDADARAAIAERRAHARYLQPILAAAGAVQEEASGRKVVRYEHRHGWLDAEEFLDVLRLDGDFAAAFPDAAPPKTTTPAKPLYDKPNPFARKTFSLTEQMRLQKINPELASRLREEANQ
jgi:hypothetical protein